MTGKVPPFDGRRRGEKFHSLRSRKRIENNNGEKEIAEVVCQGTSSRGVSGNQKGELKLHEQRKKGDTILLKKGRLSRKNVPKGTQDWFGGKNSLQRFRFVGGKRAILRCSDGLQNQNSKGSKRTTPI